MKDKKNLYGSRWRKARLTFLSRNPICSECERQGKTTAATVVDHIEPHRGDWSKFWDSNNWQPLCKHCHDSHKQRLERSGQIIGGDEKGNPIDPGHHWNR